MSARRFFAAVCVVILTACAGTAGTPAPSEDSGGSSADPSESTVIDDPSEEEDVSPLDKSEATPDGLEPLLAFKVPTADTWISLSPGSALERASPEARLVRVRFTGFDSTRSVHAVLTGPGGVEREEDVPGGNDWLWTPQRGQANMEFVLTVTQDPLTGDPTINDQGDFQETTGGDDPTIADDGADVAQDTPGDGTASTGSLVFHVTPAIGIGLEADPRVGSAGTTFEILLAGFEPASTVTLYLYAQVEDPAYEYEFRTGLGSVVTNDSGAATFSLVTQSDDQPGKYAIMSDPPAPTNCYQMCAAFEVTA